MSPRRPARRATVGLVGATLGGGFGLLTRAFGMASDNLLAAEIVVASGVDGAEAITVDEHHHADLLWALRGAGNGNFGIVTSLTYRVRPLRQTVYVTATWPGLDRTFARCSTPGSGRHRSSTSG